MSPASGNSSSPLRVGYVIKMFPRLSETFILNEVLELEDQGVELRIFSLKRPVDKVRHRDASRVKSPVFYLPETLLRSLPQILRAQVYAWRKHPRSWRRMARSTWRRARPEDRLAFCQACCIVQRLHGIRHLHAHYANIPARVALLAQRLAGVTFSITTHAKDIFQNDPFASSKLRERMSRASFIVANSRFSAEHVSRGLNAPADIRVVYNGLDLAAFPLRSSPPARALILGVGRLVEKKGFADFVTMCSLLKKRGVSFEAKIVGTGVLTPALKEQIRLLNVGDRINLAGPMPHQVLREVYAGAAVFVLPCKQAADGDRDILPNAVKEAMAVGVPVVTTSLDGIEELVEDGVSGLLVPPGDPAALAQKVQSVIEDAGLAARLANNGRNVVECRFDRKKNFRVLRAAFEEVAGAVLMSVPSPGLALTTPAYDTSGLR